LRATRLGFEAQLWWDRDGHLERQTDARGNAFVYGRDAAGRLASIQDPAGNVTRYHMDAADRVKGIERDELRADGGRDVATTTLSYDARDRVKTVLDPLGNRTFYAYADRDLPTTVTDALGATVEQDFDAFGGLLVRRTVVGGSQIAMTWTRDGVGLVTSHRDHTGSVTEHRYDGFGDLAELVWPDGSVSSCIRGEDGDIVSEVTPGGSRIAYSILSRTDMRSTRFSR
jgi:YD repeat-containing protein